MIVLILQFQPPYPSNIILFAWFANWTTLGVDCKGQHIDKREREVYRRTKYKYRGITTYRRYTKGVQKKMTNLFYAKCCTIFSASGIIFLLSLGVLLDSQPLYVKGLHDKEAASTSCYGAAGLYASSFLISLFYWYYNSRSNADAHRDSDGNGNSDRNWGTDDVNNDNVRFRRSVHGGGRRYEELQTYDNEIF